MFSADLSHVVIKMRDMKCYDQDYHNIRYRNAAQVSIHNLPEQKL